MEHTGAVVATGILATAAATASAVSATGVEVVTAGAADVDAVMAGAADVDAVMAGAADVVVTAGEEGSEMESTLMIGETGCSHPYPDFSGVFSFSPK